jgi:arylesterase/paraoxonase
VQALAQVFLKSPADNSVGFCRRGDANDWACKIAADRLHGSNGIARSGDTFYVANHFLPQIHVLERQADDTLALTDVVATGV